MGAKSKIQLTNATWNPIAGCTKVTEGCVNCYALRMTVRLAHNTSLPEETREKYARTVHKVNGRWEWTGELSFFPERLNIPLRWRKPRMVFVCSMSDLFHKNVPASFLSAVFGVMRKAKRHTFQVLTKRAEAMKEDTKILNGGYPLPNVWGIVTAENQRRADERIPHLLQSPFAVRGVSIEPMLGPIYLSALGDGSWWDSEGADRYNALCGIAWWGMDGDYGRGGGPKLDWVICGGESGPGARPMNHGWVRSLRDQCIDSKTPFFFKQWGEYLHYSSFAVEPPPKDVYNLPGGSFVKVGKKRAGNVLDGEQWLEFPGSRNA